MKIAVVTIAGVSAAIAFTVGTATSGHAPPIAAPAPALSWNASPTTGTHPSYSRPGARGISTAALNAVVQRYCASCHNPNQKKGNLVLEGFDVDGSPSNATVAEKVIRKLRAQMMPPPGSRKPAGDTLLALVETMEQVIDKSGRPNPGNRTFQRLNRPDMSARCATCSPSR